MSGQAGTAKAPEYMQHRTIGRSVGLNRNLAGKNKRKRQPDSLQKGGAGC
jgi:hypothetical protein